MTATRQSRAGPAASGPALASLRHIGLLMLATALTGCSTLQSIGRPSDPRGTPRGSLDAERLPCSSRKDLIAVLAATRAQAPVAQGLAAAGGVVPQASIIEVLASVDGLSWTAILTAPNGTSCAFAAGEAWQNLGEPRVELSP